jgi:hypothetical protein
MIDNLPLPRVEGVDMSFLPAIGAGVNVSAFAAGDRFLCVDSSDDSSVTTDDSDNASDSDDASNSNDDDDAVPMMPMPKKARRVYVRKPMNNCAWWTAFLSQESKAILINEPDGKDATYDDEYALLVCDAAVRKFSVESIARMLNRPDVPAQVTNNHEAHVDEAVLQCDIKGLRPTMGCKQVNSDLPSVRVCVLDDDDNNDIEKVGSPTTSNNDEEDDDDDYGDDDDDGEDTKKLETPTSDEENEKDNSPAYDDEETDWDDLRNWCPMMPTLNWQKIHENYLE